ncbi:MAG: hypothetical protein JW889_06590 [Verrucomicrobia bacterium]|nr:hypothetical protein [Verrucomicrobiota bacterium]
MNTAPSGKYHFKAHVRFYSREEGGSGVEAFPSCIHCPLEYKDEYFDCALILKGIGPISPGEETPVPVPIQLLSPQYVMDRLRVGDHFRLWAGKYIGEGEVVSIKNPVH